ncbi:transposase, partial [Bifidobacterium pseudolongum subsp. globosum]
VEVIDPFHVVHLAAGRLTMVRCRLQREATGRRGVKGERLYDCVYVQCFLSSLGGIFPQLGLLVFRSVGSVCGPVA